MLKILDKFLYPIVFVCLLVRKIKSIVIKPKEKDQISVGLLKLSAFGDVLKIADVLTNLELENKKYKFDLITTKKSNPEFFSSAPVFTSVIILNPLQLLIFAAKNLFTDQYDVIIDLDQYYLISGCIASSNLRSGAFHSKAKNIYAASIFKYNEYGSEYDNFRGLICMVLGICKQEKSDELLPVKFSCESKLNLDHHGQNLIILYPGSSENAIYRRWPLSNYVELAKLLLPNYCVRFVGGPDELGLCQELDVNGLSEINLINQLSLIELTVLFRDSVSLFVGNDAGLLHLADSQRVPCFGIYGPNLFEKWGGVTTGSKGFWSNTKCRPCIKNGAGQIPKHCKFGEPVCVTRVTVAEVAKKIKEHMEKI